MASIWQINAALALSALLVLAGIFTGLIARRFGAPLILTFLFVGLLAGVDGPGSINFDDYEVAYLVGPLAFAVILFDGGMRSKLGTLRAALWPTATLATAGVALTAAMAGAAALAAWSWSTPGPPARLHRGLAGWLSGVLFTTLHALFLI